MPDALSEMRAPAPGGEVLQAIETALVRHRAFGDSLYIRQQLTVAYLRRLHKLRTALPQAGQLVDQLQLAPPERQRQLVADTVLRCAVQHAMRQLALGDEYGLPLPQCDALFGLAAEHLRLGLPGAPLVAGLAPQFLLAGDATTSVWPGPDATPPSPHVSAFLDIMQENYGAPLATPTASEMAMLRRGLQLLDTLLPRLTRSALSHVQLLALFPKVGP